MAGAGVGDTKSAAALLILQFATMWGAFFILAPAINWPASLDAPPSGLLPLILDRSGAVFAGYLSNLVHALVLIPLAVLLRGALGLTGAFATVAITLGVLAGFAKAPGCRSAPPPSRPAPCRPGSRPGPSLAIVLEPMAHQWLAVVACL